MNSIETKANKEFKKEVSRCIPISWNGKKQTYISGKCWATISNFESKEPFEKAEISSYVFVINSDKKEKTAFRFLKTLNNLDVYEPKQDLKDEIEAYAMATFKEKYLGITTFYIKGDDKNER